jgi:hypothetical protein
MTHEQIVLPHRAQVVIIAAGRSTRRSEGLQWI